MPLKYGYFGLTLLPLLFLDTGYALSCIQNALKLGCKKRYQHQARAFSHQGMRL